MLPSLLTMAVVRRRTDVFLPHAVIAVLIGSLSGCGAAPNKPGDPAMARQALTTTLDAWKSGGKPEDLKAKEPSIVVNDIDWQAGRRLTNYQVGKETDDGVNLHVTVELVLSDDKGEQRQQITYVIGTHPVITVFRDQEI